MKARYNGSAPAGAGNTTRGLTQHQSTHRLEGFMKPTHTLPDGTTTNRRSGHVRANPETRERTVARIKARMQIATDGCWLWTGHTISTGYGEISVDGIQRLTHRVMYEAHVGPIPDGLVVDHVCLNRACCNPDHLRAVTRSQNNQRIQSNAGASSSYRGVSWSVRDGKWIAQATLGGQYRRGGNFDDEWEAACAAHDLRLQMGSFDEAEDWARVVLTRRTQAAIELFGDNSEWNPPGQPTLLGDL